MKNKLILILLVLLFIGGCSQTDKYELGKMYFVKDGGESSSQITMLIAKSNECLLFWGKIRQRVCGNEYYLENIVFEIDEDIKILSGYETEAENYLLYKDYK